MSAELVHKSLEIVDPNIFKNSTGKRKKKKIKNVFNLIPESQKIVMKVNKKGQKAKKVNILSTTKKLTVVEAKRTRKTKEEILKQNLNKLKQIREACTIKLDDSVTNQIIERAVTGRPLYIDLKAKPDEKTAFTEEDFEKFEKEYFGE